MLQSVKQSSRKCLTQFLQQVCTTQAVWPDDWINNWLISPKIAQQVATHFLPKSDIIRKVTKIFGLVLRDNLLPRTCKNFLIWSHWTQEKIFNALKTKFKTLWWKQRRIHLASFRPQWRHSIDYNDVVCII